MSASLVFMLIINLLQFLRLGGGRNLSHLWAAF